jgi:hypothetical protein
MRHGTTQLFALAGVLLASTATGQQPPPTVQPPTVQPPTVQPPTVQRRQQPYYPPQPQYPPQPYYPPAPAAAPAPPPPKRLVAEHIITEPRYGLVAGGAVLFPLAYLAPLIIAGATDFENESEWLAIPLLGPLITMGERNWDEDCPDSDNNCSDNGRANDGIGVGLTFSALLQLGGAVMFITGLAVQRTRVEKIYAIVPLVTDDTVGVGMMGRF